MKNREVVEAFIAAFNRGDVDAACGYFSSDAKIYGVLDGSLSSAREAWANLIRAFHVQFAVEAMCAEGETIVVRYRESGTFSSSFGGIEPTGRSYEATALHWFEFSGGKIVRRWGARHTASIYRQLGIGPLQDA